MGDPIGLRYDLELLLLIPFSQYKARSSLSRRFFVCHFEVFLDFDICHVFQTLYFWANIIIAIIIILIVIVVIVITIINI